MVGGGAQLIITVTVITTAIEVLLMLIIEVFEATYMCISIHAYIQICTHTNFKYSKTMAINTKKKQIIVLLSLLALIRTIG